MVVINFIVEVIVQLLSTSNILIGLFVMVGLLLQHKKASDVIKGVIKTILGLHLISDGAGLVIGSLTPLNTLMSATFGLTGTLPINETCFAAASATYGTALSGIIAIGMIANLVIARFSKFKFVYMTGHEMMWVSTICAFVLSALGLPMWQVIVGGGLFVGLYMAVFPAILYKDVCKVTGSKDLATGHTGITLYWLAARIAQLVGGKSKSAEEVNFPKSLNFLRDLNVSLSLAMFVIYIVITVITLISHPDVVATTYGSTNFIIACIEYSIEFAAAVYVLMAGVRLMVAEMVPGFQGIAEKFIPNAVPALDIPVLYPYMPNSTLIGFVTCSVAFVVAFVLQVATAKATGLPVILPTLFNSFFYGATMGCVANANGGLRGVIVASFIGGIVASYVPALLINFGGVLISGTTFGGSDSAVIGIFLNQLGQLVHGGIFYIIIVLFCLPFLFSIGSKKNSAKEASN